MADAKRRLGIIKRVSLKGLAEGWDDAFILVSPATYPEMKEFKDIKPEAMSDDEGLDLMLDLIKSHFVGGSIMLTDDEGNLTLDKAQKDDVDSFSMEINNAIFEGILGTRLDPKATQLAPSNEKEPTPDDKPTVTE